MRPPRPRGWPKTCAGSATADRSSTSSISRGVIESARERFKRRLSPPYEPPLERLVERAQAQRLRAFGAAGASARVPGVGIDVGPGRFRRDEVSEIESGDHRAGEARLRDVVEVGDLAIEELAIGFPERQAPERIALGGAGL